MAVLIREAAAGTRVRLAPHWTVSMFAQTFLPNRDDFFAKVFEFSIITLLGAQILSGSNVNSAAQSHLEAVQKLFLSHQPALQSFVLALVPDFVQAEDIVQETFLTVTRKAADFELDSNFLAWACSIAKFKVLEAARVADAGVTLSPDTIDALCVSEAAQPADPRVDLLEQCVDQLAPKARRVVELCYRDSHKPSEVARLISWSPSAVHVALSRARALLRKCLEKRFTIQPGGAV